MKGLKTETVNSEPIRENGWINTEDRISEILYGVIMALTFTCTISVTKTDKTTLNDLLFGALSCNTAWGLIDAVMYLVFAKTDAARGASILRFVRKSNNSKEACQFITDALPSFVADVMQPEEIETIRQRIALSPEPTFKKGEKFKDFKTAVGIFFIVLLSTFPVAMPFLFHSDLQIALRISNAIGIVIMFLCGWGLGKYAGRNSLLTGLTMSVFGIILVMIAIALGG